MIPLSCDCLKLGDGTMCKRQLRECTTKLSSEVFKINVDLFLPPHNMNNKINQERVKYTRRSLEITVRGFQWIDKMQSWAKK
jgi:hypothetical protein